MTLKEYVKSLADKITALEQGGGGGGDVTKAYVDQQDTLIRASVTSLSNRVDSAEGNINKLDTTISGVSGRVDTAEENITALDGRVDTLENDLSEAEADIIINQNNIEALAGRMTTAETNITDLDGRLYIIENDPLSTIIPNGAGPHNGVYRGTFLGSSVSTEQYANISNGTFNGLFIGDYWTIGGVNYRIAAFDYYINCGDSNTTNHHVVIVPDTVLYNYVMNDDRTSAGAYVGSKMYTEGLDQAKSTINNAFSGHVLNHRVYLTNAVSNGYASAGSWFDSEVELMNELMVYGCGIFSPVSNGTNAPANYRVEKSQLPLFALDPSRISIRANWWLRDVITSAGFAYVARAGSAEHLHASASYGVRPSFCIY